MDRYFKLVTLGDVLSRTFAGTMINFSAWIFIFPRGSFSKEQIIGGGILVFILQVGGSVALLLLFGRSKTNPLNGRSSLSTDSGLGYPLTNVWIFLLAMMLMPWMFQRFYMRRRRRSSVIPLDGEIVETVLESDEELLKKKLLFGTPRNFDDKWTQNSKHFQIAYGMGVVQAVIPATANFLGFLGPTETGALIMVFFLIMTGFVFWEASKKPPVRNAIGHMLSFMWAAYGVSSIPNTIRTISLNSPSGLVQTLAFVGFIVIISLVTYCVWKMSIMSTASFHESVAMIFVIQIVDDLMADLLLGFQKLDIFFFVSAAAMIVRLVLRDTGKFEDAWNWVVAASVGDPVQRTIDSLTLTEQEIDEFRLYKKVVYRGKYLLFANQDFLSEHTSVVVIPMMLLFDIAVPGDCLIACGKTIDQVFELVIVFIVLFFIKLAVNKVVLMIQTKQLQQLQNDWDAYEGKWGKIPRESPLHIWRRNLQEDEQYQQLEDASLAEIAEVVKKDQIQHWWPWFTLSCVFAMIAALNTGGLVI